MTPTARRLAIVTLALCAVVLGVVEDNVMDAREMMDAEEAAAMDAGVMETPERMAKPKVAAPSAPVMVGGFLGLQHYFDCPRYYRGLEMRLQVAHKSDRWPVQIACFYGLAQWVNL